MAVADYAVRSILNFNVGVLGHVDSGKTSLAKALSTTASTASFDKNPQSKERGITLDLGFSSFCVDIPKNLVEQCTTASYKTLQFTLVDCPGHASLIRTIIGGAQIIDLMMLVIDIVKGVQTQTAECLVIGEITCDKMLVVLNKIDLIPEDKKQATVDKMKKKILKTLERTKFAGSPIVSVAARPGGPEADNVEPQGISELIDALCKHAYIPKRDSSGPFVFSIDHCFLIRGQGTVMTGTILQGGVAVNDVIEIQPMKASKKIKSMQMFRKPIDKAIQGDRVGICVTQFDPKLLERGVASTPGFMAHAYAAIASVYKIPYFKGKCTTKSKFHISILHETVMARTTFFGNPNPNPAENECDVFADEYVYQEELLMNSSTIFQSKDNGSDETMSRQYVLLEFDQPVLLHSGMLFIGSKLDTDIHANVCRLAFYGNVLETFSDQSYAKMDLPRLKVYKMKTKEGAVERMTNEYEVIGRSMFKKETNIQDFVNLKVSLSTGEEGIIEGGFGQSGKFKIRIPNGLKASTMTALAGSKKRSKGGNKENAADQQQESEHQPVKITLNFKRYIYDPKKKMIQI